MKNNMLRYVLIVCLTSFSYWSTQSQIPSNEKKLQETVNTKSQNPERKIKHYHVEETVSLKFGGYMSEYDVTNLNMINTYDLGPNGTRTVTPVYEQIKHTATDVVIYVPAPKQETLIKTPAPVVISETPKKKDSYAYIDVVKTYERVTDKGYESIDMLKKVGNSYFFNSEYDKAEKCYTKLFSITKNLEPEYYYRYSITLKAIGNTQKSDEFLKKFNLF